MVIQRWVFAVLMCSVMLFGQHAFADGQVVVGGRATFPAQDQNYEGSGDVVGEWGVYIVNGNALQEIATSASPNGWQVSGIGTAFNSNGAIVVAAPSNANPSPTYYACLTTAARTNNPDLSTYKGKSAQFHVLPVKPAPAPGPAQSWQGSRDGINTGNGNKTTSISLLAWTARGGMPVSFALTHNSQSSAAGCYGPKWTASYDVYTTTDISGNVKIYWGNGEIETYTILSGRGSLSTPAGESNIFNTTNSTLTTEDQVVYHFKQNSALGRAYLDSITDQNSNKISINRLSDGRLSTIVDPTGRTLSFGYDSAARLATVTDPLGRVWTMAYDGSGNLAKVVWPALNGSSYWIVLGYNGSRDIASKSNLYGEVWSYGYNGDDSTAWEQDPCSNRTNFSYGPTSTTITDANGNSTTHNYSLQLASIVDPLNKAEVFSYDWNNQPTSKQNRRGYVTTWSYGYSYVAYSNPNDPQNVISNVITTEPTSSAARTLISFNSRHKMLTKMDALNNQTTYSYDANGNLYTITDPLGHVDKTDHVWGLPTQLTDALGHASILTYDNDGNLTQTQDANGNKTSATYNSLGWKTSSTDGLGNTTTYTYDTWGRMTAVTDALSHTTTTTYDGNSNVTAVQDANGSTATNTYDSDNRLLTATNGRGDKVTYVYDAPGQAGLLSRKTDGNGVATTYTYTTRNEVSRESYADGTSEAYGYDASGNKTSDTHPESRVVNYAYDAVNRLAQILYQNAGFNVGFTYDDAGRRTKMTDDTGTTAWSYDNDDRLVLFAAPTNSIGYAYDNADRRTVMTEGSNVGSWSYSYDNGNRLTQLVNPSNETTTFAYDAANRLQTQTNALGLTTTTLYDNASRTTGVQWGRAGNPAGGGWDSYAYDSGGRLTQKIANDGSTTAYGYDLADQLISEQRTGGISVIAPYSIGYTYDHNANRLSKTLNGQTDTYHYVANTDELQSVTGSWGTKTYVYDPDGTVRVVTVNGSVTNLNTQDNYMPYSINYGNGTTENFAYNGLGQRVYYQEGSGRTHNDTFDGAEPGALLLSDNYAVYTPGVSEHHSDVGSLFYNNDALGSPRSIINTSNAMTDDERFDGFGNAVYHARANSTATPYGFVGKKGYQTDASGLLLLGHRYYDPAIGRFLSRDPIHDGNNWYAYCDNNPLDRFDPTGQMPGTMPNTDETAMHEEIMEGIDDLVNGQFMASPVAGQSSVTTPAGAEEAAAAAQDAGEAGNTGVGKPGKIDVGRAVSKIENTLKDNVERHIKDAKFQRSDPEGHAQHFTKIKGKDFNHIKDLRQMLGSLRNNTRLLIKSGNRNFNSTIIRAQVAIHRILSEFGE